MKKYSLILFPVSAIFLVFSLLLCFLSQLYGYALFTFTIALVAFAGGMVLRKRYGSPAASYESRVQGILNTFDSILVRSSSVPILEGRNIVEVMSIDDLVDAQLEIRKPICYLKQTESCSFVLLDEKEAYIYVEKLNDTVKSPVEIAVNDIRLKSRSKEKMDSEMLKDIEKTTVVRLSNKKSYKVSPVRKDKKEVKESEVKPVRKEDVEIL